MAGTEFEQTFESTFKKLKDLKDISSNFQQILTDDVISHLSKETMHICSSLHP